ncbi:MAG: hypothetical protein IIY78_02975 [Clostridia bacterium]|nr:hypothetical protein [Clostridia bacterium]
MNFRRVLKIMISCMILTSLLIGVTLRSSADSVVVSEKNDIKYHKGDVVEAVVQFGNIKNGNVAGYNYNIYYDNGLAEPIYDECSGNIQYEDLSKNITYSPNIVINEKKTGEISMAMNAPLGVKNDVSGESIDFLRIKFTVKCDISDPGIAGECVSLSVLRAGSQIDLLSPVIEMQDVYSTLKVDIFQSYVPTPTTPNPKGSSGTIKYTKGSTIDAVIDIGNISDGSISALNYIIYYDPEYVEPVINENTNDIEYEILINDSDVSATVNATKSGLVKIALFCITGAEDDASGEPIPVFKVRFKVNKNASDLGIEGACTILSVIRDNKVQKILARNIDDSDTYTTLSIIINQTEPVQLEFIGDVDHDGVITSSDALIILRMSVGLEIITDELRELADVDSDGSITSSDALEVLRFSVGLPTLKVLFVYG